jgi:hypothetical protein
MRIFHFVLVYFTAAHDLRVYDVKFAGKELAGLGGGKVKSLRSFRKLKSKVHSAERRRET